MELRLIWTFLLHVVPHKKDSGSLFGIHCQRAVLLCHSVLNLGCTLVEISVGLDNDNRFIYEMTYLLYYLSLWRFSLQNIVSRFPAHHDYH